VIGRPTGPVWELLLGLRRTPSWSSSTPATSPATSPLIFGCRELGLPVVVAANLADEADGAASNSTPAGWPSSSLPRSTGPSADRCRGRVRGRRRAPTGRAPDRRPGGPAIRPRDGARVDHPPAIGRLRRRPPPRHPHSLGAAALDEPRRAAFVANGSISSRGAASLILGRSSSRSAGSRLGLAEQVERRRHVAPPLADRIARLTTRPWPGLPLFIAVTLGAFGVVVIVGGWAAAAMSMAWAATVSPWLAAVVPALVPWPALASALLWALDGGLLGMLTVGLPYVLTFYLVIAALEDSGYLTSAAVLMDRLFAGLGLGRAAIPLTATGCNVPAIYGTRVLRTRRERLIGATLVT
jgi:hypothetical protein